MTQEEKELLLKDLCARLPYGVMIQYNNGNIIETREMGLGSLHDFIFNDVEVKPYLRPMSSMTREECLEFAKIENIDNWILPSKPFYFEIANFKQLDWLQAHHFDHRGLIPMGLALEAPEYMYKHFGDMDVVVTSVEHKDKL